MIFNKKTKIELIREKVEKQEKNNQKAIEAFFKAFEEGDKFECIKKLGVLELYKVKDLPYYSALGQGLIGQYEEAINSFQEIMNGSEKYNDAGYAMLGLYERMGKYNELENLFEEERVKTSPAFELYLRLCCLNNVSDEWFINNIERLKRCELKEVGSFANSKERFLLYTVLCDMLIITGEILNELVNYRNFSDENFYQDIDCKKMIFTYEKYCVLLSYSRFVKDIRKIMKVKSMADCALYNETWDKKIDYFINPYYHEQILMLIKLLFDPQKHLDYDPKECVVFMASRCLRIKPQYISKLVSEYFDLFEEAYQDGNIEAIQLVNYVYGEVISLGIDPYHLKKQLELFIEDDSQAKKTGEEIFIARKISKRAHSAYINAESTFEILSEREHGVKDYSTLSLQFFRVLEIIYVEKMLKPLSDAVSIESLQVMANECENDKNKERWLSEIKGLKEIKNGNKQSLELGKMRSLLAHITGKHTKDDACAKELKSHLNNMLTEEGKIALDDKKILDTISKGTLDKYRVPGAHTGYLPFSVACESREYVRRNMPIVLSWFKN